MSESIFLTTANICKAFGDLEGYEAALKLHNMVESEIFYNKMHRNIHGARLKKGNLWVNGGTVFTEFMLNQPRARRQALEMMRMF